MREPLTKFPTRPTGRNATLQTLAECRALLAKPRLSPEMREALEKKIGDLTADLLLQSLAHLRREPWLGEESTAFRQRLERRIAPGRAGREFGQRLTHLLSFARV